jgi:hypothetical protein
MIASCVLEARAEEACMPVTVARSAATGSRRLILSMKREPI